MGQWGKLAMGDVWGREWRQWGTLAFGLRRHIQWETRGGVQLLGGLTPHLTPTPHLILTPTYLTYRSTTSRILADDTAPVLGAVRVVRGVQA